MKIRYSLSAALVALTLALAPAAFAADEHACCTKTAAMVQKGEACAKCVEGKCCQDTAKAEAKKMADAGKKMEKCAGCEAKKKAKAS